jgi:hypothetical protein
MSQRFLYTTALILTCAGIAAAQGGRGGANWATAGGDPQRSGWVRADPQISRESVTKGVVQFLWKTKLDNAPRQLEALTPPAVTGRVITYKGFKDLMFISGSSDKIWSIDHPLGKIFWETKLPYAATYPQQTNPLPGCPGGLSSVMALNAGGPGSPYGPFAAGVTPPPAAPPAGRGAGPGGPPAGGRGLGGPRLPTTVYALSSDGLIHTVNQHSGEDITPAYKFIRPNSLARGLVVADNVAWIATTGGCGGTPNGIWSMDLGPAVAVKELSTVRWLSGTANIEGSAGFALGTNGTVYAATGDGPHDPANGEFGRTLLALDSKTLKLKDWYTPANDAIFRTAPVFFNFKEKDYLTVADQQGRLYILDAAAPGGADHKTPLFVSPPVATVAAGKGIHGALTTWQDGETRWILAPFSGALSAEAKNGGIAAYKVVEQGGKLSLQAGWTSRDLTSPAAPIVVNGVVFALSTGENMNVAPEQRATRSAPAVLYALDGTTGKEMWTSGRTIAGFSHSGGLASGASKVFVSTHDGTLYAFGYMIVRD